MLRRLQYLTCGVRLHCVGWENEDGFFSLLQLQNQGLYNKIDWQDVQCGQNDIHLEILQNSLPHDVEVATSLADLKKEMDEFMEDRSMNFHYATNPLGSTVICL